MALLKTSQNLVLRALKRTGFECEYRHWGERRIAVWKKSLRVLPARKAKRRLVFIPGFGDSPFSWIGVFALLIPVLRKYYDEIVFLEFPGFSGTIEADIAFDSFDALFKAVDETLDSLKPKAILAHSLGGWLAGHYACREPVRALERKRKPTLEQLFLVAPSGVIPSAKELRWWATIFRRSTREGIAPIRPHLFAKEPAWFRLIEKEFSRFTRKAEVRDFLYSFRARHHRLEPHMEHVRAKTWLIWGEKDTLVPTSWSAPWLKNLAPEAEAQLVVLKRIGHSPQLESTATLVAILGQIMAGYEPHPWGSRWYSLNPTEPQPERNAV